MTITAPPPRGAGSKKSVSLVAVTVDLVILTIQNDELHVLLITRTKEPFPGMPALPGGYVNEGETLMRAALRKLTDETGANGGQLHLEQLRTYDNPGRDPRGRVITVAYMAFGHDIPELGVTAHSAGWVPVKQVLDGQFVMAFDHAAIVREALEKARSQFEYTTIAAAFCPVPFTMSDLRRIYEAVWDLRLDPSNFRRKVTRAEDFVVPTDERRCSEPGRPSTLYRRGQARMLYPPVLRSRVSA
jgi:ADP-ribose pyrophosphatase YjhB (NUDIX family)